MSHSRAKLNPLGRELLISRIGAGWSMRAAARAQGISAARASVLWQRYQREGAAAFSERSSRPHHSPRRLAAAIERRIERARRRLRQGPLRLSWALGIARSTIYAVLRRLGLNHRRVFAPPRGAFRRYERLLPGDLVHIDTKKVGRLPAGGGKRFNANTHSKKSAHTGWEYVHVAVDDRTRVQYSERLRAEDGPSCAGFTARALLFFADHGVRVRQVMTDNAFSYVHGRAFATVLASAGVEHRPDPAVHPPLERQGRGIHRDPAARVGLCPSVLQQPLARSRLRSLRRFVQFPPHPRRARRVDPDAASLPGRSQRPWAAHLAG